MRIRREGRERKEREENEVFIGVYVGPFTALPPFLFGNRPHSLLNSRACFDCFLLRINILQFTESWLRSPAPALRHTTACIRDYQHSVRHQTPRTVCPL